MSGWFLIDFLSVIPLHLVSEDFKSFRLFRLLRLVKIARLVTRPLWNLPIDSTLLC